MMTSFDAWVIARLRADREVKTNVLALVSKPLHVLATSLADAEPQRRDVLWQAFLDQRDGDRDALMRAVVNAEPDGPRPEPSEADDEPDEGWGPIRLGTLPTAEPFPLEVLPPAAANLVDEASGSIGCPPDFVAVAILATAGGTIGRSISLRLKGNAFASPNLYVALIGPPSDGKSPALRVACSAIRRIDEILQANHGEAVERWKADQEANVCVGKKSKPSAPPHPQRIDIDDATMESLPSIMADNPRGLILIKDELSALMMGMNQYKGGKGSDKQFLLSAWSGTSIKIDRVKHDANIPTRVPHPCLSIVGAMTPDLITSIADPSGKDDGFVDRFLFAYPDSRPIPDWTEQGVDDATLAGWSELVARLWQRPLNVKEGRSVPHVALMSGSARDVWTEGYNRHCHEMNAVDFPGRLRGPWGKFREYAGRIVLILACLDHAADPLADPTVLPSITPRIVRDAWRVIDYFKAHARRVHATLSGKHGQGNEDSQALLGWIGRNSLTVFSIRDINRNFDRFKHNQAALEDGLKWLIARNLIRPQPQPPRDPSKGGRNKSPAYEVHPTFHTSPQFRRFRQMSTSTEGSVGIVGNAVKTEVKG